MSQNYRMCVDYRKLNKVTVNEVGPLPNIQEIFDDLQVSEVFNELELKIGYHQV